MASMLGREALPWSQNRWNQLDQAADAEFQRLSVASRFIPLHGPFLRRRAHLTGGLCREHSSRFTGGDTMDVAPGLDPTTACTQIDEDGGFRFRLFERFALHTKNTTVVVRLAEAD
jgi:hypothetical protein